MSAKVLHYRLDR